MTEDKKENWFVTAIKALVKMLGALFSESSDGESVAKLSTEIESGKRELKAREVLGAISEDAKDVVIEEGSKFLLQNSQVLLNLTPEQKEYAMNLAYLKAIEHLSELSLEELIEYRKLSTKVAELGPDVAKQLHSFWEEFKNCVNAIVDKVSDIGIRGGAIALKAVIPVL